MPYLLKTIAQIGYHQLKNLYRFILRRPLTLPSFNSATLDEDDVALAKLWLNQKEKWGFTKEIEQYQQMFASWNGSAHAFSFMGGRVALSAIIHALELEPDDEAILPGYTCVVVPNAFEFAGLKIVFSDIELETYGLDAAQLEEKITAQTKVILLHHLYGLVCRDYLEIIEIARKHNLYVVEDCAHSAGAEYNGRKVGNLGDAAFYSSEQSKVFNTIQGGIAVTNDPKIAQGLKSYYEQAPLPDNRKIEKLLYNVLLNYYRFKHPQRWWRGDLALLLHANKITISTSEEEMNGRKPRQYGQKLPLPLAQIGINQLKKIDKYNAQRRISAERWDKWCEANNYQKPVVVAGSVPIFLRYPVLVKPEKKRDTSWGQKEEGVEIGVWFVSHKHPAPGIVEGCPNASLAVRQCINLPCIYY